MQRSEHYHPGLAWFSFAASIWTLFLLFSGGFTTSIQAGMAFLDWPLSNGSLNPSGWTQQPDQLAEHSHRLMGMKLGFLSIVLLVWAHLRESRRWVRRLALALFLVILLQGVLGGLRVLMDNLNMDFSHNRIAQTFAVFHACGAQIVLCLLVTLTVVFSRPWIERQAGLKTEPPSTMRHWGIAACATIFLQILLGAIMRHWGYALAIPTFPLTPEGGLLPSYWNTGVVIHFAHRAGALVVTIVLVVFLSKLWNHPQTRRAFGALVLFTTILLALQIYLGALTIWTVKNPHAATLHTLGGALLLAATYALTFLCYRLSSPFCTSRPKTVDTQPIPSASAL